MICLSRSDQKIERSDESKETRTNYNKLIPVKNGKYPCYVHSYSQKSEYDDYDYENVFVAVEGIEGCYLNRNKDGEIFFDKSFRESLSLKDLIQKK